MFTINENKAAVTVEELSFLNEMGKRGSVEDGMVSTDVWNMARWMEDRFGLDEYEGTDIVGELVVKEFIVDIDNGWGSVAKEDIDNASEWHNRASAFVNGR